MILKHFLYSVVFCFSLILAASDYPGSIRMIQGTPVLHVNDKPIYASALRWQVDWGTTDRLLFADQYGPIRQFGEAGTPVFFLGIDSGWKGPELYDYAAIDRAIEKVFKDNPEALLIPSIHLEYTRWYAAVYPDEAFTVKENGTLQKQGGDIIASFSSPRFEAEAKVAITRLIEHLSERGYTNRIIGYQLNYGATAEWRYWDQDRNRPDWNPHAVAAWRNYVQNQYGTLECLNAAWKTTFRDFSEVLPPAGTFYGVYHTGYLRDPLQDTQLIDYEKFVNDSISRLMHSFAVHVKQLTGNKALVGCYTFSRFAREWLEPVDFTVCSTFYPDREANGTALSQALALEAHRKLGKLYWHDADMRTYLWPDEYWGVARNVYESVMLMRKEFGTMLVSGAGNGWLNLHHHRNVFANPVLMKTVAELEAVASTAIRMNYDLSSNAEIAVVYDRFSAAAFWNNAAMYNNYTRIGAPVDFFPIDMLDLLNPMQYKMIVIVCCPRWNSMQQKLLAQLKGNNRTLVFLYANGMETEHGLQVEAAEQLMQFKFKQLPGVDRMVVVDRKWQSVFGSVIPALGKLSAPATAFRLTVIPQSGDTVIGRAPVDGEPLLVRHEWPEWTAWYLHNYQTHSRIFRRIAELAGVSVIYPYEGGYFQGNRHFFVVCGEAGVQELRFQGAKAALDIFADRPLKVEDGRVKVNFQPNETKLLLIDTPERIQEFRQNYQETLKCHSVVFPSEQMELEIFPADKTLYLMPGQPLQLDVRIRTSAPFAGGALKLTLPATFQSVPVEIPPLREYEVKTLHLSVTAERTGLQASGLLTLTDSTGKIIRQDTRKFVVEEFRYLGDLPRFSNSTGWGSIEHDRSCSGLPLEVGSEKFAKGIGVHAPSELVYELNGQWNRLSGAVGVDRAAGKGGLNSASCVFSIFGDGRELFHSGRLFGGEPAVPFEIKLSGVKLLKLVVEDGGDGRKGDHGDWCNLRLYPVVKHCSTVPTIP